MGSIRATRVGRNLQIALAIRQQVMKGLHGHPCQSADWILRLSPVLEIDQLQGRSTRAWTKHHKTNIEAPWQCQSGICGQTEGIGCSVECRLQPHHVAYNFGEIAAISGQSAAVLFCMAAEVEASLVR